MQQRRFIVPEFFVNGIERIDDLNGSLRFTFFEIRNPIDGWDGYFGHVDQVAIIMPTDAVCPSSMQAAEAVRRSQYRRELVMH